MVTKKISGDTSISKIDLFKILGNFDSETCSTRIVSKDEFTGKFSSLICGNGGSWCRRSAFETNYKAYTVKQNGQVTFLWDATTEEKASVRDEIAYYYSQNTTPSKKTNAITLIKIFGSSDINTDRPVRADIRAVIISQSCVACGRTDVICDHKNDLYNNPRVLNIHTQVLEDFQPLCNQCNLLKRQIAKKMRETGKRYGATNIACLAVWGIDFIVGSEIYDPSDPDAMVGTYWYDPVAFMKGLKLHVESKIGIL